MIVSTSDLLNYLRCRRYAALDRNAVVRTSGMESQDDSSLATLSVQNNYQLSNFEDDEQEFFDPEVLHQDATKKAMRRFRAFAQASLTSRFPERKSQIDLVIKRAFEAGLELKAKFDLVLETHAEAWNFTIVPMTDGELQEQNFSVNQKKWPLFIQDADGMFRMHTIQPSDAVVSNYVERLAKLSDRHQDLGRHVYDQAFKAFLTSLQHDRKARRFFLLVFNRDYVFDGTMNQDGPVYTAELFRIYDMTELAVSMRDTIRADLYRMINLIELNDDSSCPLVKNECMKGTPFECQFVPFCFEHVPKKNSILAYINQHLGFREGPSKKDGLHDTYDLINEGMVDMLDVPISWLSREKNLMQRYCIENNYVFVNKKKMKAMFETLKYPLYYLDFEANPSMLPKYAGEKPYTQSVFQFSIHIEPSLEKVAIDDHKSHLEYIITEPGDHRRALVKALVEAIPEGDSSIIVYNKTFEKNRLLELATLFPEYRVRLRELESRLFDLLKVVKNDPRFFLDKGYPKAEAESYNFYHPELSGSYSLKKVFPVFAKDAYIDLPIHSGLIAYLRYEALFDEASKERDLTIRQLKDYCRQDTYSMVEIMHGLREMMD
jgi:hypothetical protein